MRNRLQGVLGDKTLSVSALQENRTLRSLSAHMANLMSSEGGPVLEESICDLLVQDAQLGPEIVPGDVGPLKPSEFHRIFLTGATGHLGLHFIPELIARGKRVTCLLRGESTAGAKERLRKTLKKYGLQVDLEEVEIVVGDVASEGLGLAEEEYSRLSSGMDAIIHCAIKSNHLESYHQVGNARSLRVQNVVGLKNVIAFAAKFKTKPILHASSLVAVTEIDGAGLLREDYPAEDNFGDGVTNGYCLSKMIGEKLLAEGELRGIPITVLRYPSIFGDSESGVLPVENNHAWSLLLACMRVKMFPEMGHNGLPIMPVDVAVRISVELFLDDAAERGVYNLSSEDEATESVIQAVVREFGIDGKFVPFGVWRDAVFEDVGEVANDLSSMLFMYEDIQVEGTEAAVPRYLGFHPLAQKLKTVNFATLSEKLKRNFPGVEQILIPAEEVLRKHLEHYFKQS